MFYHPDTEKIIPEGVAFEIGGEQFPSNWLNLSTSNQKKAKGIYDLVTAEKPTFDLNSENCIPGPIQKIGSTWTATWSVVPIPQETIDSKLVQYRKEKSLLVNAWREKANNTFFVHEGKQIACDALSRGDIDAVAGNISLTGDFPEGFPGAWKCIDNSYILIKNPSAFKAMYASMTRQGITNFVKSQQIKAKIATATFEELDAITWDQN